MRKRPITFAEKFDATAKVSLGVKIGKPSSSTVKRILMLSVKVGPPLYEPVISRPAL